MREVCSTCLKDVCFCGEEAQPRQAHQAAIVTRGAVAVTNFSLITCTVLLSSCPPVLLAIIPCGLLLNALLSTFEILCARYKIQYKIEVLSRLQSVPALNAIMGKIDADNFAALKATMGKLSLIDLVDLKWIINKMNVNDLSVLKKKSRRHQ